MIIVGSTSLPAAEPVRREFPVTSHGATPDDAAPDTAAIQAAIDACSAAGGGTVRVPKGRFLVGGLRLKDKVHLRFEAGAVLEGSANPADYGSGTAWNDAILHGENLNGVCIEGPGVVNGVDCRNPKGEEGFRGPHAIFLTNCRDVVIEGITITRAANYAMLLRDCTGARIEKVVVRGGHDGVHAQACQRFAIRDCDFRTGDDSIAGCDNQDFEITGCKINSSCNGFRFGCFNLLVKKCHLWGPGEFQHRISNRTNMLAAFVHFAPKDRNPKLPSDHWVIEDVSIENADVVYGYDFERGLWQTGQPAKRIRFHNVKATGIEMPLRVLGDGARSFVLTMEDVTIAMREGSSDQELLKLTRFGSLTLKNVTLQNNGKQPVLRAKEGNRVTLERVTCVPTNRAPFAIEAVQATDLPKLPDPARGRIAPPSNAVAAFGPPRRSPRCHCLEPGVSRLPGRMMPLRAICDKPVLDLARASRNPKKGTPQRYDQDPSSEIHKPDICKLQKR